MSYTTYDFSESLNRAKIDPTLIAEVIAAWGGGSGQGHDSGPGWSEDGVTEWSGGFLFRLKDGTYAYVWGWCDYTGWGCQDGAEVERFTERPDLDTLRTLDDAAPADEHWDVSPADLNLWIQRGAVAID